jgi:hypothetical protein
VKKRLAPRPVPIARDNEQKLPELTMRVLVDPDHGTIHVAIVVEIPRDLKPGAIRFTESFDLFEHVSWLIAPAQNENASPGWIKLGDRDGLDVGLCRRVPRARVG